MKNKIFSAIIGLLTASGATILHNQTHVAVLEKEVEFVKEKLTFIFKEIREVKNDLKSMRGKIDFTKRKK